MGSWIRRQGPAFALACVALMVALGGSVYAASRIDGRTVEKGSLPGNRVERASLAGSRLQPRTLRGSRVVPHSLTGLQVDSSTLGPVPEAAHADSATTARSANTALSADRAANAERLNGHAAGCATSQRLYAGACWDLTASPPATAPAAAMDCGARGGELPPVMALVAFGTVRGVTLSSEGEWSKDVLTIAGANSYGVITVAGGGLLDSAGNSKSRPYRCVIPLVT